MEKVFITTQAGERIEVGVVRLFKHNDTVFFIYTQSEKDNNNYIKLYVTKINMSNVQSVIISEESEWSSFKEIMKTIIKNNRSNAPLNITDIDPKTIQNITIHDPRVFKLSEEMTNFLKMNIGSVQEVAPVAEVKPETSIPDVFDTPVANNEVNAMPSVETPANVNLGTDDISAMPELAIPVAQAEETKTVEVKTESADIVLPTIDSPVINTPEPIDETKNTEISVPVINESTQEEPKDASIDYKVAYLEEQLKVETLNTKIATLEAQVKMLEQKLEQIKNIAN